MLEDNFTIRQIETFYYTAKFSSITKAAQTLYMSTPAAWKHIKNIEELCGKRLFERVGKRLVITGTGKMLADEAHIFLTARNNFSNVIREVSSEEQQPIRLSITNTFQNIAFNLIQPYVAAFPNVRLDFTLDRWLDQADLLEKNNHDFYMISDPFAIDHKLMQKKLLSFDYILVASSKNIISQCKRLLPHDVCNLNYLSTHANSITQVKHTSLFKSWNMRKKPIYVDSYLAAKEAVKANLGIAFLPRCIIEEELESNTIVKLPLEADMIKTKFVLVYKSTHLDSGSHDMFFNFFA
ncbi:MAG: DNA-binding transcriptional LysR family regulator [Francisellaceae bacterium]|jgi:DNA-binding transcriptional LysR family regulator